MGLIHSVYMAICTDVGSPVSTAAEARAARPNDSGTRRGEAEGGTPAEPVMVRVAAGAVGVELHAAAAAASAIAAMQRADRKLECMA